MSPRFISTPQVLPDFSNKAALINTGFKDAMGSVMVLDNQTLETRLVDSGVPSSSAKKQVSDWTRFKESQPLEIQNRLSQMSLGEVLDIAPTSAVPTVLTVFNVGTSATTEDTATSGRISMARQVSRDAFSQVFDMPKERIQQGLMLATNDAETSRTTADLFKEVIARPGVENAFIGADTMPQFVANLAANKTISSSEVKQLSPIMEAGFQSYAAAQGDVRQAFTTGVSLEEKAMTTIKSQISSPVAIAKIIAPVVGTEQANVIAREISSNPQAIAQSTSLPDLVNQIPAMSDLLKPDTTIALAIQQPDVSIADIASYQTRQKGAGDIFGQADTKSYISSALRSGDVKLSSAQKEQVANFIDKKIKEKPELKRQIATQGMGALAQFVAEEPMVSQMFNADVTSRLNLASRTNRSSERAMAMEQVGQQSLTQLSETSMADIRPLLMNISQRIAPQNAPATTDAMMRDVSTFLSTPEVQTEMTALKQGRSTMQNVLDKAPSPQVKQTMALIISDAGAASSLTGKAGIMSQNIAKDVVTISNKQAASIVNMGDSKTFQKALKKANVPVSDIGTLSQVVERVSQQGVQIGQVSDLMQFTTTESERTAVVSLMTNNLAISSLSSTAASLTSQAGLTDVNTPSRVDFYATQAIKTLDEATIADTLTGVVASPRQARQIAKTVVEMRQRGQITGSTSSLSDVVSNAPSTATAATLSTLGDRKVKLALYQAAQQQTGTSYSPEVFDAAQRTALSVALNMNQEQVEDVVTQTVRMSLPDVSPTDVKRASQALTRTFQNQDFQVALSQGKVSSLKDVVQFASPTDKVNVSLFSQPTVVNALVGQANTTGSSDYISIGLMEKGSLQQLGQMTGPRVRNFLEAQGMDTPTARRMAQSFTPELFQGVDNVGQLTAKVANLPDMPEQQKRDVITLAQTAVKGMEVKNLPVSAPMQSAIVSTTYQKAMTGISLNLDKPEVMQSNLIASGVSPAMAINTVNTLSDFAQTDAGRVALSTARSPMDFIMLAPAEYREDLTPIADTKFTTLMAREAPTIQAPQISSVRASYKAAGKTMSAVTETNVSSFRGSLTQAGVSETDVNIAAPAIVAINQAMTVQEKSTATPQMYISKARTPEEAVALTNVFSNTKAVVGLAQQNMQISTGEATQIAITNRQIESNAFQGLTKDGASKIKDNAVGALRASSSVSTADIGRVTDALTKLEASPRATQQFIQSGSIADLPRIAIANNLDIKVSDFGPLMDREVMSNLGSSFETATTGQSTLVREMIISDTMQSMPQLKANEVRDVAVNIFGAENADRVMADYNTFIKTPGIGRAIQSGAPMKEVMNLAAQVNPSAVPTMAVMLNSPQFVEMAAKTSGRIAPDIARNTIVMDNASATATLKAAISEEDMPVFTSSLAESGYSRSEINQFKTAMTEVIQREGGTVSITNPVDVLRLARTPQEVKALMPVTDTKVVSSLSRRAVVKDSAAVQNIEFETVSRISSANEMELSRPVSKVYGQQAAAESMDALARIKANPAKMARLRTMLSTADLPKLADTDQDAVALARFGNTAVMNEFLKPIMDDQMRLARQQQKSAQGKKGGIDLNPVLLDMEIQRDGSGVPLPINQQILDDILIDGFSPTINNIIPLGNAIGIFQFSYNKDLSYNSN